MNIKIKFFILLSIFKRKVITVPKSTWSVSPLITVPELTKRSTSYKQPINFLFLYKAKQIVVVSLALFFPSSSSSSSLSILRRHFVPLMAAAASLAGSNVVAYRSAAHFPTSADTRIAHFRPFSPVSAGVGHRISLQCRSRSSFASSGIYFNF